MSYTRSESFLGAVVREKYPEKISISSIILEINFTGIIMASIHP
jgi:hypothetical protein